LCHPHLPTDGTNLSSMLHCQGTPLLGLPSDRGAAWWCGTNRYSPDSRVAVAGPHFGLPPPLVKGRGSSAYWTRDGGRSERPATRPGVGGARPRARPRPSLERR